MKSDGLERFADENFKSAVHTYWGELFEHLGWTWSYSWAQASTPPEDFILRARFTQVRVKILGTDDPESREFRNAARAWFDASGRGSVLLVGRQAVFDDRSRRMYLGRLWRNGRSYTRVFDPAYVYLNKEKNTFGLRQDRLGFDALAGDVFLQDICTDDFSGKFQEIQNQIKSVIWWRSHTPIRLGELLDA